MAEHQMPLIDTESIEKQFRELLATRTIEQVIALMHSEMGVGLFPLCKVVEKVADLPPYDAKRLVVQVVGNHRD